MNFSLLGLISAVIQVFTFLIIARAVGSFFVRDWSQGIPRFLWDVTEPLLAPVRRILPPFGGLDFSPLVVILVLSFVNNYFLRAVGG